MNAGNAADALSDYRAQARRLLKDLRRDADRSDAAPTTATAAAERFVRLRSFANTTVDQLLLRVEGLQLKHALAVVAQEAGHSSWLVLKRHVERQTSGDDSGTAGIVANTAQPVMYERSFEWLLNTWFAHYDQARTALEAGGGFLLPYKSQFFICEEEGIHLLGLDPGDPDWAHIGNDWVKPADVEAWTRLRDKRLEALASDSKLTSPHTSRRS